MIGASEELLPEEAPGVFFSEQSPEAVQAAVERFAAIEKRFDPEVLQQNSERFIREFGDYVMRKWEEFTGIRRG